MNQKKSTCFISYWSHFPLYQERVKQELLLRLSPPKLPTILFFHEYNSIIPLKKLRARKEKKVKTIKTSESKTKLTFPIFILV
jgi:hypothetical protein